MSAWFAQTAIREGVFHGLLTGCEAGQPPALRASWDGTDLSGLEIEKDPSEAGCWRVSLPVPVECLNSGAQSLMIADTSTGQVLATFAIVAGEQLDGDLAAEVTLLRAELDMLKRAFRRYLAESRD